MGPPGAVERTSRATSSVAPPHTSRMACWHGLHLEETLSPANRPLQLELLANSDITDTFLSTLGSQVMVRSLATSSPVNRDSSIELSTSGTNGGTFFMTSPDCGTRE